MRGPSGGGGNPKRKRVRVRARPVPKAEPQTPRSRPEPQHTKLNHRQQRIVHQARELAAARGGSDRHKRAAATLQAMNLTEREHRLAERAAAQHEANLRKRGYYSERHQRDLARVNRQMEHAPSVFPMAARGLKHGLETGIETGHQASQDIKHHPLRSAEHAVRYTKHGLETGIAESQHPARVTEELTGINPRHPLSHGGAWLAGNAAFLLPGTRVGKLLVETGRAAHAGEGARDAIRAGLAARRGETTVRDAARRARKTEAGKKAAADLRAHPVRKEVHRQIDATPDITPREKRLLKNHFDDEVHAAVAKSGKTVDELFRDPRVRPHLEQFHGYAEPRAAANLRSKLNPRLAHTGLPGNATIVQEGDHVLGPITPEQWVARVLKTIPDLEVRRHWATWYDHVIPLFEHVFGEDAPRILRGFAVSQANASPSDGLTAVLRVLDKVDRGMEVRPDEFSAVVDSIKAAVKGDPVEKGVAAKLSDFIDSLQNRESRTWMGHDPRGGRPAAIDVHALRDLGYVDQKLVARLEKRGLVNGRDFFVDSPGVAKGPMYERASEQYQAITDHLNQIAFDGRTNWKPAEVQALGWATIQKFHGTAPEDLAIAVENNTREVMAPASGDYLREKALEHNATIVSVQDGSLHAIMSPENARQIAQEVADEVGEANILWLRNQSQARTAVLTVNGAMNVDQARAVLAHGFTHVHEGDGVTRFFGPKGVLNQKKLAAAEADARAHGLDVDTAYTQRETRYAGHGKSNQIPERPKWKSYPKGNNRALGAREDRATVARRAELRGRVYFTEGSGPAHLGRFLDAAKRNPRAWNLTEHDAAELADARVFLSVDGEAGFVISKDGDLQNVFNNVKGSGAGPAAVQRAVREGAVTLDAYDGFLPEFYRSHGFVETGRMKFVDEYAPDGWDFAAQGRPDVVFMTHGADPTPGRYFTDFDEAKNASRLAAISDASAPLFARDELSMGINPGPLVRRVIDRFRGKGELDDALHGHTQYAGNAPEGAAAKAMYQADDAARVDMVKSGEKPAAIIVGKKEADRAKAEGLLVEHDPLESKYGGDYYHVARDKAAMADVRQANASLKAGHTVVGDYLFGKAMGYSDADIAKFLADKHGVELADGVTILSKVEARAAEKTEGMVYHGTTSANADKILRGGVVKQSDDGRGHVAAWFTEDPSGGAFRGDVVLGVPVELLGDTKRMALGIYGADHDVQIATRTAATAPEYLDKPLSARDARASLHSSPIRDEAHANIEQSYGDPELQKAMKKAWDDHALAGAEHSKMTPSTFLEHRAAAQPAAVDKARAGLRAGKAQTLQREQEVLRNQERGKRASAFREALLADPTMEGASAASAHLAGTLPKLEFNGIRGLSHEEVDDLVAHVATHPGLRDYEAKRVIDAVRNAYLEGKVPTRREYELMQDAFGRTFAAKAFSPSVLGKYRRLALDVASIPRSLMASFDVSAPFRQGFVALARHPIMTSRNFRPMFKYLTSEKGYRVFMDDLRGASDYEDMLRDGLAITDIEHALEAREEYFQSQLAERITGGKYSPVRASGRAYTGFLVKTRVDMYRYLMKEAERQGHVWTQEGREQLAGYINSATGRGTLGRFERDATSLNAIFFSPRLMASRLDFLNPMAYMKLDPFVRQQKLRAAFQTAAMTSSILWLASQRAGVSVSLSPFDSDFGKIKIGNTRIDIAGGFVQYIRIASTLAQSAAATLGVVKGDPQAWDKVTRFFRGKLSPLAALTVELGTHTTYYGGELKNVKKEIYDSFIPLVIQDARDVYEQTHSVAATVGTAIGSGTGLGVNAYGQKPDPKTQTRSDKADAFNKRFEKLVGTGAPPEVLQAEKTKEMYDAALKRRKDELGTDSTTPQQRTYVKLAIIEAHMPQYADSIAALRASVADGPEVAKEIDAWAEDALGWNTLDAYHEALKP